ncbi:MAG: hypothetical protein WC587_00195 [Candidatus Paceibacterota bacterium]
MKLNFKINKYYLLVHSLGQRDLPFPEWKNLQNKLWKKYPDSYLLLSRMPELAFIKTNSSKELSRICSGIEKIISIASSSREFTRLLKETKKYLEFVKNQWNKNRDIVLTTIEELSGLKISNKTIEVLITHPKLRNGINFPQFNAIGWGHIEDWENYTTVYLAHELTHILTSNKYKDENIIHALIEMMTDNELRIRLNRNGKYFKEGKFEIGHTFLRNLEKQILPYWRQYLKTKNKNIFKFEKKLIGILPKK